MTLSSLDIKNLLLNHKTFMGCYPCNRLPPFPKKQLPRSLIVNTDQSHESGNHWIAMILTRKNCLYFDSFGVGVLESDILKFIEEGYNSYIHSVKEIQAIKAWARRLDELLLPNWRLLSLMRNCNSQPQVLV